MSAEDEKDYYLAQAVEPLDENGRLKNKRVVCRFKDKVVEVDENGRVWLSPWAGSRNNERIDVTDREDFDWKGFAAEHIGKQIYKNKAKIDVFSQLEYVWDDFVTYLWTTRLKWERDALKYHK